MDDPQYPTAQIDEYTVMGTVNVTEVATESAFTLTFAVGPVGDNPALQLRALTSALVRSAAYYDQMAEGVSNGTELDGVWAVTQTHNGNINHYTADSERSADELARTLPGIVEVNYQYTIGE